MRNRKYFLGLFLCFSFHTFAIDTVQEEQIYLNHQRSILSGEKADLLVFNPSDQALFVDALADLVGEQDPTALRFLEQVDYFNYPTAEKLRVELLRLQNGLSAGLSQDLSSEVSNALKLPQIDHKLINLLAAHENELLKSGHQSLIDQARLRLAFFNLLRDDGKSINVSHSLVKDLFHQSPHKGPGVQLFIFCRKNRNYPCLMTMKDSRGRVVKNQGKLWTQPALAASAWNLPSYMRNGNTPAGVYTINGVMPVANQQLSFGKYRRLILNFIPASKNENLLKSYLPRSSSSVKWWQPSVTGRQIGRNLLRIHGTGRRNHNTRAPYFPFMKTSGCIAQRENTYRGVTYRDQRKLLDALMKAQGLATRPHNETRIKGVLYLIEIDNQKKAVSLNDLVIRGIK